MSQVKLSPEAQPSRPLTCRAVTNRMLRADECERLDARDLRQLLRPSQSASPRGPREVSARIGQALPVVVWKHGFPLGVAIVTVTGPNLDEDLGRSQLVPLSATEPHLGGRRWWLLCPYPTADGQPCWRRVRVLYRPQRAAPFGCRHCHRLTYRSRQRHRNWFYEGIELPMLRNRRLLADLRSRSPRRRFRALSKLDPGFVNEWTSPIRREGVS